MSVGGIGSLHDWSQVAQAKDSDARAWKSPYRLEYTHSLHDLVGDLEHGERGESHREASISHLHWYSHETRHRYGSWGPRPRRYLPLEGLADRSLTWKRERVIAAAARFIGYAYQHHHIPDWNPPASWPWQETCAGHNGKGVDCSNFTSFVYNQGFGIHMTAAVERQSQLHQATQGEHAISLRRVELPRDYAERQKMLHTGDLLYIRGREEGPVTHVVLWVGSVGRPAGDVPLIMDSHGSGVRDDEGNRIPCGIHLRPFRAKSWYNRCASHALRVFHEDRKT